MRIALCDDCQEDAVVMNALLIGHDVSTYGGAERLLMDMEDRAARFDLYLLDIFMGDSINGIELAKRIRRQDEEAVICFVSSSDDFYREAYDLYAVQYLLKPVREQEIQGLLEKVSRSLVQEKEQSLSFQWKGELGSIAYGRILYISSRGHTLSIHCKDGKVQECTGKLGELAARVGSAVFCRCHQSFLVNMYQVEGFRGNDLLVGGELIPVSRRYCAEVKRRYQEILFEEVD